MDPVWLEIGRLSSLFGLMKPVFLPQKCSFWGRPIPAYAVPFFCLWGSPLFIPFRETPYLFTWRWQHCLYVCFHSKQGILVMCKFGQSGGNWRKLEESRQLARVAETAFGMAISGLPNVSSGCLVSSSWKNCLRKSSELFGTPHMGSYADQFGCKISGAC